MADPRVLLQQKAELRGKIESYKASPAASRSEVQAVIATCEDEIKTIEATLNRYDRIRGESRHDNGAHPALMPQGSDDPGSDFGWPGNGNRRDLKAALAEEMEH